MASKKQIGDGTVAPRGQDQINAEIVDTASKDFTGLFEENIEKIIGDMKRVYNDGEDPKLEVQFKVTIEAKRNPQRFTVEDTLIWTAKVKREQDGFGGVVDVEPTLFDKDGKQKEE